MGRIAYVNRRYVRHDDATTSIDDRGYQFADGVYEVTQVARGAFVDLTRHLDRLDRSLAELRIRPPMGRPALIHVLRRIVRLNRVADGYVYLQVSRGVAPRDHYFPAPDTEPVLVVTATALDPAVVERRAEEGVGVISVPEARWARVDIKTIGLLPNVLAKQAARDRGAREAWFVDSEGHVTEGGSANAWIVTRDGVLVTRPLGPEILPGVTRAVVLDVIAAEKLPLELRPFTLEEAYEAREAFVTSASQAVMPVVRIDDRPIANGRPGSIASLLRSRFADFTETVPV